MEKHESACLLLCRNFFWMQQMVLCDKVHNEKLEDKDFHTNWRGGGVITTPD